MSMQSLSPVQMEAVSHVETPAIVTAGAGSGKTRTLTNKIAYLVNNLHYDPERILAITFTNKAADEMKSRLEKITGRSAGDFPWVRTFHSACFKILKVHCELLGYRKPLLIHDASQQKAHLKKVLAELNLDRHYLFAAASLISKAKNSADPVLYLASNGRVPRRKEAYRIYNEMLAQSNSVDFDDILLLTRDLLQKYPEIRKAYRNRFDYILVDEFQDSNEIQNQIIDLLLKDGRLTVVGDDYQSIYQFRGANPFHFINFPQKYAKARVFRLEENFRSTRQIVTASDRLIAHNLQRIEKQCFSRRDGQPVTVETFYNEQMEAEWVADRCRELLNDENIPYREIAILYRTKFTSLPFERALRSAGVPYTMVGAQGFFQRREVQDINAYLICAVNPSDDISFERIVNVPRRGIGPGALKKIFGCKERNMSLRDAARKAIDGRLIPKKAAAELDKLLSLLESIAEEKPDAAMHRVMKETDYFAHLSTLSDDGDDLETRLENIKSMIYDAAGKASIPEYLEDAALIRDDQDETDNGNGVRLSTIHAAKGLEFKAVFVVAVEEGILPHRKSIETESEIELERGMEEERRLMYVAMTRASELLSLSAAATRRGELARPSPFLAETGL
ncbi:ATP-dependent helicase [Syntrophobacter fumaroxidans]|uniref:DNA 3'-5' helicase n=1 Tax=Syntrophobacter fumaroxidans (strain DSM 10017 / MPOB) TaxID=335543 RepID=A0LFK0_SYNFM|nr:ATP-dependent helicase [Syntrophobacter fumaroxidans]ABK16202.1 ATP-dependent DNA helicase, Rep family [Syntrophobacter fumaroxidans MPOB]